MSKKINQPIQVSTIIDRDQVNSEYTNNIPAKQPKKSHSRLSLAWWVANADKPIALKYVRRDNPRKFAVLGLL